MNMKAKIAILVAATLLTLVGFNLIVYTGAVELVKAGKEAGYEIMSNVQARAARASLASSLIKE